MSDLLTEVDEAMRRERLEKLWKEHGKSLLAGLVLAVLAVGLISAYRSWDEGVRQADTAKLMALLESPDFPENVKVDELKMRSGPKGIALLTAAGTYLKQDRKAEAQALYAEIANNKSIPGELRDLGILMQVRMLANEDSKEDLIAKLQPILKDKNSPWIYHAEIEAAALYANRQHDYAKAREALQTVLTAQGLPNTLTAKAQALDHVYALKQTEQEKTKAGS